MLLLLTFLTDLQVVDAPTTSSAVLNDKEDFAAIGNIPSS